MSNVIHFNFKRPLSKIFSKGTLFPKPYPIEWILLFSGILLTFYYSWIVDDAYVFFRYVDNLLFLHKGLVYNQGEYVEGFSSPGWVIVLIILRFLHLNYWLIIRFIAAASFVVFWALLIILNRKLSEGQPKPYIFNYPLIHLSLTYGVLCYFSSGLETPLVLIAAAGYACIFLFPQSLLLQSLLGLSPLIRHELAVPYTIVCIWFLITRKRIPWTLFLCCAVSLGGLFLFRVYYYADLLPNTFYLKEGLAIKQGLYYLYDTIVHYATGYILLFFLFVFIALKNLTRIMNFSSSRE